MHNINQGNQPRSGINVFAALSDFAYYLFATTNL